MDREHLGALLEGAQLRLAGGHDGEPRGKLLAHLDPRAELVELRAGPEFEERF